MIAETLEAATEGGRAAGAALRDGAGARRPRWRRKFRAARRRRRQSGGRCSSGDVEAGLAAAAQRGSRRPTRRRRNITTRWSRTPSSRHGTAIRCRSIRRARAWRWRRARIAGLFGIAPEKIHIRSPFLGGGFGSKGLVVRAADPGHHGGAAGRPAGQAGAAPRADVRPGRPSRADPADLAHRRRRRRRADRDRPSRHDRDRARFDDFFEPAADASHTLYASPAIATSHEAVRLDTGTPLFMRAPGEATGSDRAGKRDRRDGAGLRHGSAGVPPEELRRGRADIRQAVLLQGAARMLRAGRRAVRLGTAARWRRGRCATTAGLLVGWGMGTATFPALMFQAQARAVLRSDGSRRDGNAARTTWARAPGPRWPRSPPTASGSTSSRSSSAPARPTCRTPASPAAPPTPRPPAWRSTTPAPTSSPSWPISPPAIERSPLFGAGNAGVIARSGRLFRRDDESRSESYADILARAGLAEIEGRGSSAADPAAQSAYAMHAHGAVFAEVQGRSRSRPDPRHPPGRRLRRRQDHQSAPGAQPVLRRHDLGRVVRPARAGRHRPPLRPDDERQPRRVPRAGERRRALARSHPGRGARSPRQRARASRASARSASPAPPAPSPTPSGTRPAYACAASRSRSRS